MTNEARSRRVGEKVRLTHALERLRAHLDALSVALSLDGPIGSEAARGVTHTAIEVAMQIARHDAFALAEAVPQ